MMCSFAAKSPHISRDRVARLTPCTSWYVPHDLESDPRVSLLTQPSNHAQKVGSEGTSAPNLLYLGYCQQLPHHPSPDRTLFLDVHRRRIRRLWRGWQYGSSIRADKGRGSQHLLVRSRQPRPQDCVLTNRPAVMTLRPISHTPLEPTWGKNQMHTMAKSMKRHLHCLHDQGPSPTHPSSPNSLLWRRRP